ncbi:hypothetical protein ACTZNQ_26625, partial [Klebsiella pneumoniae]
MGLKPGPKPIAKSTGKPDQRRRDNKDTPGNTPGLKPREGANKQVISSQADSLIKISRIWA